MRLTELLVDVNMNRLSVNKTIDPEIRGMTADSRRVSEGFLFAALEGVRTDGRRFINDAIEQGAVAILAPLGTEIDEAASDRVDLLTDENPRRLYALMAAQFFANQPDHMAAVTGTNGKSSVADFTRQIWTKLGVTAASMGTLGVKAPMIEEPGNLTTPDPIELHQCLHKLSANGVDHGILEASSHGLTQFRLDGVELKVAAFTNLSRDHLDYHGTMESYLEAKTRLFSNVLGEGGVVVLNADDDAFEGLVEVSKKQGHRIISYGRAAKADLHLSASDIQPDGQALTMAVFGERVTVNLPLIGEFQAMNAICALAIVLAEEVDLTAAVAALESLEGVRGRMELAARRANSAAIFVDYAHTPDALRHALDGLRLHTAGKLKVVFGCGGDRDQGKRPVMGAMANGLADQVFITDDNPRFENPEHIRRDILSTVPEAGNIAERRDAIFEAVSSLQDGDILLVAGKGHEQGQIIGDKVLPFDDCEIVREAVREADA